MLLRAPKKVCIYEYITITSLSEENLDEVSMPVYVQKTATLNGSKKNTLGGCAVCMNFMQEWYSNT
jgi:hypothetical protein